MPAFCRSSARGKTLTNCILCGEPHPNDAMSCPHCGFEINGSAKPDPAATPPGEAAPVEDPAPVPAHPETKRAEKPDTGEMAFGLGCLQRSERVARLTGTQQRDAYIVARRRVRRRLTGKTVKRLVCGVCRDAVKVRIASKQTVLSYRHFYPGEQGKRRRRGGSQGANWGDESGQPVQCRAFCSRKPRSQPGNALPAPSAGPRARLRP